MMSVVMSVMDGAGGGRSVSGAEGLTLILLITLKPGGLV